MVLKGAVCRARDSTVTSRCLRGTLAAVQVLLRTLWYVLYEGKQNLLAVVP